MKVFANFLFEIFVFVEKKNQTEILFRENNAFYYLVKSFEKMYSYLWTRFENK